MTEVCELERVGKSSQHFFNLFLLEFNPQLLYKTDVKLSRQSILFLFYRLRYLLHFLVPLHPFRELVQQGYSPFFKEVAYFIVRSFRNILIAISIDYVGEHFEIEGLMHIGGVFYEGVISKVTAF